MTPSVTILIVTHGRAELLRNSLSSIARQNFTDFEVLVVDDADETGEVKNVCAEFSFVRRIYRANRKPVDGYCNPAIPFNMGLKAALGQVIVMQGGEILYTKETDLQNLVKPHFENDIEKLVMLATCEKIGEEDGAHFPVNADDKVLLFNFGCSFRKSFVLSLGGFEESYDGWGYEDEDLALVMIAHGVQPVWLPPSYVLTHHQYHPWVPNSRMNTDADRLRFAERKTAIFKGHISNEGHEWGIDAA